MTENKTWDDSFAPNEKIDDQKENSENVPKDEEKVRVDDFIVTKIIVKKCIYYF